MEPIVSSPNNNSNRKLNQTLPPRRGLVKIRIIKSIIKSVTSIAVKEMPRKREEESGPDLSSSSTTAAATPTGYNSD